jgi:hypothetical protein
MATIRSLPSSSGSGVHRTSKAANTTAAMPTLPPTSPARRQRQSPVAHEQAEPEPDIEPRRVEPGQAALFAQRFERLDAAAGGGPGESRGVARRVALPPELVFSEGKVSGKLALQVMVGPTATERAHDPTCPLAKRGADLQERHAGSSKRVRMTDTI